MDNQVYQTYFQLAGKSVSDALHAFKTLNVTSPADGDRYFETFGVGHTTNAILQPYERFACYEFLLHELKKIDDRKFYTMHKGTPYYFLAWTAFDIGDYEKAVFYLDASFSEDIRKSKILGENNPVAAALNNPGGWLLRLNPQLSGPAVRVTSKLKGYVEEKLKAFNSKHKQTISLVDLINKFVIGFIKQDSNNRSVITTFYSFIYEFNSRHDMLTIRSKDLGSLEPILVHLFKGGLIFETLLKYVGEKYGFVTDLDKNNPEKPVSTIGSFNYSSRFINSYCKFDHIKKEKLEDLVKINQGKMKNAFGVVYKIRNITGHDLRRKDVFKKPEDYKNLFEQEIAAILYIIQKEFLTDNTATTTSTSSSNASVAEPLDKTTTTLPYDPTE